MSAQEGPKHKRPAEKRNEESRAAIEKAKAETALTRAKDEERARLKAEEALAETREALAAARENTEQERLARVKAEQTRAEAETALAETRKAIGVPAETMKTPPRAPGEEGEQRISFIVRLTVDERGQPRRTEVEQAQTGKKEAFPGLDVQRLAAFMEACFSPPDLLEAVIPSAPPPADVEAPKPEPLRPRQSLIVSDVRVFRMGAPGVTTLTLSPDEALVIRACFQLQGPEAPSLTAQESSFEVRVYAREVTKGTSALLTTYGANLVENVLEYSVQMQVSELSPGLYRLVTLVTLDTPLRMAGHHDGPIVHVFENQPSANPAPFPHGPLSQ